MGVKIVVTKKLPYRAMNLVRAVFDDNVHHSAGAMAIFSRVAIALDTKLLHRIHGGKDHVDTIPAIAGGMGIVVDPVEQIVVLQRPVSVDADGSAQPLVRVIGGAWRQQHQLCVVALV